MLFMRNLVLHNQLKYAGECEKGGLILPRRLKVSRTLICVV